MSINTSKVIGKYKILNKIGNGAMGVVYKAFDESIQRPVAIKVLHDKLLKGDHSQAFIQRFKQEAQAAARCLHPNIVTIFEYGIHSGTGPFIAMEFVEGIELKQYQRGLKGELTIAHAVNIVDQVLKALQYAHSHGVVHRDIKPSNIILLPNQQVKVMDFGVARLDTSDLTLTGHMVGTPSYMSPEGLRGSSVDVRSDLYTVGLLLFELLTGRKYRLGEDSPERVESTFIEKLPQNPIRDALVAVIQRAIQLQPDNRYQSALDFSMALEAAMSPEHGVDDDEDYSSTVIVQAASPAVSRSVEGSRISSQTTVAHGATQEKSRHDKSYGSKASRSYSSQHVFGSQDSRSSLGSSEVRRRINSTFSEELLKTVEKSLSTYIGPMAKQCIRRGIRSSESVDHLMKTLGSYIPDDAERQQFYECMERTGVDTSSGSVKPGSVSPEKVKNIIECLTYYLGPMAARFVKSEVRKSEGLETLIANVANKIPDQRERDLFLKSVKNKGVL